MGFGRWFRMGIGLLLVVVPLWALLTRLDAIWNGHPAYLTTLLVTVAGGLTVIAFALYPWRREPEPNGPPWETDADPGSRKHFRATATTSGSAGRRNRGRRVAGRVVTTVLVLLLIGFLGWLRPFPAGSDALAAVRTDEKVTVVDNPTTIELTPTAPPQPTVGLVFSPGARVDSRAYAALLRPVAEAGYLVVILKAPFGLPIAQIGQSEGPIADHPEISTWAVGGHSLGGVSAASFASSHLDTDQPGAVSGLLLWASYPNGDLSAGTLRVESISGTNDGLTTPADVEASRSMLPAGTSFTVIDGGVHAFFGDYGEQPGDGVPTVPRDVAATQITMATTAFLGRLRLAVTTG